MSAKNIRNFSIVTNKEEGPITIYSGGDLEEYRKDIKNIIVGPGVSQNERKYGIGLELHKVVEKDTRNNYDLNSYMLPRREDHEQKES